MKRAKEIINVFERDPPSYDEWYKKPMGFYAFYSELEGLDAMLPSSGLGLDIGAGTGIFAKNLTTFERDIICLDASPNMLKEARKRGLPSIIGTVESLPIRKKKMNFAYMVTVIEFLPDPLEALGSIRSVLKKDASLVILFINRNSPWGVYYTKLAEEGNPIFIHSRLYTFDEVSSLITWAGYQLDEFKGTLNKPPDSPGIEYKLVEVSPKTGVIIIKIKIAN